MTRVMTAVAMVAMLTVACGRQESGTESQSNMQNMPAPGSSTPASTGAAEITFKSEPATPLVGENALEVMVMQDGKPVNDAQVSVEFQMPAMPQMNMAEMKNKTELSPAGNGVYRGKGQVMMAGDWNVTVTATRSGQELGTRKLTVTAK